MSEEVDKMAAEVDEIISRMQNENMVRPMSAAPSYFLCR